MSAVATAVVGGAVIGGIAAKKSADKAAKSQTESSKSGIAEERRQFNAVVELLKPYVEAGTGSLEAQQSLLGLAGPEAQQEAIDALEASPQFESLVRTGEESILQNAAATGGLRGGNVKRALSQYRPEVLSQLIESQFNKLGTITNLGQSSAAGQAVAAQNTGSNIANLLGQIGQAKAGSALAEGQAYSNIASSIGNVALLKGMGAF